MSNRYEPILAPVLEAVMNFLTEMWDAIKPRSEVEKVVMIAIVVLLCTVHIWAAFVMFVAYCLAFASSAERVTLPEESNDKPPQP